MKFGRAPATLMILSIFRFLFPLLWERVRVRDLVRLNGALPFARLSLARNLFSENFLRWASPLPLTPALSQREREELDLDRQSRAQRFTNPEGRARGRC